MPEPAPTPPRWRRHLAVLAPLAALAALWLLAGLGVGLRTVHDALPEGERGLGRALAVLASGGWDRFTDPWTFFALDNQKLILNQTAITTVAACGMTLVIVAGGIDLSVGAVIALCAVAGALALRAGGGPAAALGVAVLAGGLCGAASGALSAGLRLMPFIATLGMMGVARGVAKWLGDNQTVNYPAAAEGWLGDFMTPYRADWPWWQLAPGILVAAAVVAACHLVLARSVFGRQCYAVGSNPAAARLCGVRVRWVQAGVYALAGLLAGLAGFMEMARLHQGDPTTAGGRELDVIAAVVIGGASLSGGTGTVLGTVVGALIMGVLRSGSNQLDWPTYAQEIIIGAVIVAAVALDRLRCRG